MMAGPCVCVCVWMCKGRGALTVLSIGLFQYNTHHTCVFVCVMSSASVHCSECIATHSLVGGVIIYLSRVAVLDCWLHATPCLLWLVCASVRLCIAPAPGMIEVLVCTSVCSFMCPLVTYITVLCQRRVRVSVCLSVSVNDEANKYTPGRSTTHGPLHTPTMSVGRSVSLRSTSRRMRERCCTAADAKCLEPTRH